MGSVDQTTARVARVGVIGDVHCQADALERVIATLGEASLDAILCVGDIVDGPGDADVTCSLLRASEVQCVAGNHERWLLAGEHRSLDGATQNISAETRAFLQGLPKLRRYETPCGNLLLCHGVGEDDESMLRPDTRGYGLQDIPALRDLMLDPSVDFMVCGHTHQRMVRQFVGLIVVNAGTLYDKFEQSFVAIDFAKCEVIFYSAAHKNFGETLETVELPLPKKAA